MGSTMVQIKLSVGSALTMSIHAVAGSGITSMSAALMTFHPRMLEPSKPSPSVNSNRHLADFFRSAAHCLFPRKHEHLSVADFARFRCSDHHVHCSVHHIGRHHHFDFYLREKIHRVLAPSVDFGVSLLPAKPFDLGDSHPFDAKLGQRFFHLFELERFNDGFQFFHVEVNSAPRGALQFNANGSTRSHSNAATRMQSRIFGAITASP